MVGRLWTFQLGREVRRHVCIRGAGDLQYFDAVTKTFAVRYPAATARSLGSWRQRCNRNMARRMADDATIVSVDPQKTRCTSLTCKPASCAPSRQNT